MWADQSKFGEKAINYYMKHTAQIEVYTVVGTFASCLSLGKVLLGQIQLNALKKTFLAKVYLTSLGPSEFGHNPFIFHPISK